MKSVAPQNLQVLDENALDGVKGGGALSLTDPVALLEPLQRFTVPRLPPFPSILRPRPPLPDPPPFHRPPVAAPPILRLDPSHPVVGFPIS